MPKMSEPEATSSGRNPLVWVTLIVICVILFVLLGRDREVPTTVGDTEKITDSTGSIDRNLLIPPGMRARQFIDEVRAEGAPYPLTVIYEKAERFMRDGSLADAHLLYFFAAREDHLSSIMKMAEMSDPSLFRAENSLLDQADVIQAYKWYIKAAEMGHQPAIDRVTGLKHWALTEVRFDNPHARQLLLNFK